MPSLIETNKTFLMIDNYIYLHHLAKYIVLPSFIDSVTDSQSATFNMATPLSRTAPIYSYSHSGPRTVQVTFDLHRDLLYDINKNNTKQYKVFLTKRSDNFE